MNDSVAFSRFSVLCHYHLCLVPRHVHHPKKKPCTHEAIALHSSTSAWPPLVFFLKTLWIYLFWTFHINGIIHYVTFGVWLLSLSVISEVPPHYSISQYFTPFYGYSHPNFLPINLTICHHFVSSSSQQPFKIHTVITPILWARVLRLREK